MGSWTTGQLILVAYALFMMMGGAMGARKGSKVSLYAGVGSGIALLAALALSFSSLQLGLAVGAVLAAILTMMFFKRYSATKKFMPSGMLLIVSLAAVVSLGYLAYSAV